MLSGLIWVQTVCKNDLQTTLAGKELIDKITLSHLFKSNPLSLLSLVILPYLTLYAMITPLKYHVFENSMENGAFALLEQMLHFP